MIHYLNSGERNYKNSPTYLQKRDLWEIQLVLQGEIFPYFSEEIGDGVSKNNHLWCFGPESLHGWKSQGPSEILVFHFSEVPTALKEVILEQKLFLGIHLERADVEHISELWSLAQQHQKCINHYNLLIHDKVVTDLSVFILGKLKYNFENTTDYTHTLVEQACSWYRANLMENPSFEQVCSAMRISTAHLRRLFYKCRQQSPKDCFSLIRHQQACHLLSQNQLGHAQVAHFCGFGDLSSFSRAFKQMEDISPREWQKLGR